MSNNENATTNVPATTGQIPAELLMPAPATVNPWEVELPIRTISGTPAKKAVTSNIITDDDYVTVKTRSAPQGMRVKRSQLPGGFSLDSIARNTVSVEVASKKLMNANGELARDQYVPNKDAEVELAKMNDSDRLSLLNQLYRRGFFPGKQGPSITGRDYNSISAMEQFLAAANPTGYTWDVAKTSIFANYEPIQGLPGTGGAAKQYSVSSNEEISSIADKVAESIIGRKLSESDINKIIARVQSAERNAALSTSTEVQQAPSAQITAEEAIQQQYGQESAMMRFGELGSSIDALLRGM